jgi:hypothetical protein
MQRQKGVSVGIGGRSRKLEKKRTFCAKDFPQGPGCESRRKLDFQGFFSAGSSLRVSARACFKPVPFNSMSAACFFFLFFLLLARHHCNFAYQIKN